MEKIKLADLPYPYDALSPTISAETLHYHHDNHHRGYVDKLNELLPGTNVENASLEEIVLKTSGNLFNQAGQHWNHIFYWNSMTPNQEAHLPHGKLATAIKAKFQTLDLFKKEFEKQALSLFGSGWMWLVVNSHKELQIMGTKDGDTPTCHHVVPLLGVDVWEHAYYLDYRNQRASYLSHFWDVANWEYAEKNLESFSRFHLFGN